MAENINITSFAYFILFLIPMFFIMKSLKIDLIKKTSISIGRMGIQMALVGIYLQYIFLLNNSTINILYVLFMIFISVWTIISDIKIKELRIWNILFVSQLIPVFIALLFFSSILIDLNNPFEAKYLIPLTGMILGNCLNGLVVALGDFLKNLKKNNDEYLFSLALGANKKEALRPYFADAISLSIKPNIASMASIGIVSLPGMMTGQILGGSLPILAIKYQVAIMLMIFITRFFSSYILLHLLSKFYFNSYSLFDDRF